MDYVKLRKVITLLKSNQRVSLPVLSDIKIEEGMGTITNLETTFLFPVKNTALDFIAYLFHIFHYTLFVLFPS